MELKIKSDIITPRKENSSNARFFVVSEELDHPDLGKYRTYGIQVNTLEHDNILHDVSTCEETVKNIVELINSNNLSPIHLQDVVMDMIP